MYKKNPYKGKLILKEDVLQERCLQSFKILYGDFLQEPTKPMIVHIANETAKETSFAYHNKMIKQGKVAGIPDLMIIGKNKIFFVELKAEDCKTNAKQEYIAQCLNYQGFECFVCKTEEEFLTICKKLLTIKN